MRTCSPGSGAAGPVSSGLQLATGSPAASSLARDPDYCFWARRSTRGLVPSAVEPVVQQYVPTLRLQKAVKQKKTDTPRLAEVKDLDNILTMGQRIQ
jgi:hypothetical protein